MKPIQQIFEELPSQWGLRGDQHMWNDLKANVDDINTDFDIEKFDTILEDKFREIIERDGEKRSSDIVWFSKYPQDGMSGGGVSLTWWREIGLPLLKDRFLRLKVGTTIKVKHRFVDHQIDPDTKTLIVGTFNPEAEDNQAEFFYGRSRNYMWRLLPTAFGEDDLKGASKQEKLNFIARHNIDFVDLISEIEVAAGQEANYDDAYIDSRVTKWKDVPLEIDKLKKIERVCLTRKTFSDIPNMNKRIEEIEIFCKRTNIIFTPIVTPARYYSAEKQAEWTHFLLNGTR